VVFYVKSISYKKLLIDHLFITFVGTSYLVYLCWFVSYEQKGDSQPLKWLSHPSKIKEVLLL